MPTFALRNIGAALNGFALILAITTMGTLRAQESTGTATPPAVSVTSSGSDAADARSAPAIEAPATHENWNFHVQNTEVVQGYPGFSAQYSGPNSLPPGGETRETVSLDLMAGVRLWSGAEAHIDVLTWQGFGLNNTLGVEGFPSGEAYRVGTQVPNANIARLFIRQTIGFGGEQEDVPDTQLTLAGKQDISRLTFTLGRFSAADIFDQNTYANSPRTQFLNWAFTNNEAWDYPADALGYTTGLTMELNQPEWTLRYGVFQIPRSKNGLTAEDRIFKWPYDPSANGPSNDGPLLSSWGMVTELERRYTFHSHPGVIRFLAYLNHGDFGNYDEALSVPGVDIAQTREDRFKYGFGLNWEQELVKNVGIFSRVGWNDGKTESWMFSDIDYTASLGLSFNGESWHRPGDTFAIAGALNGITSAHQEYFAAGGTGILAGDGNLTYSPEKIIETYYDFDVWKSVHFALDYQFIGAPAFNQDRGPVSVFAGRLHWEF